MTTDFRKDAAKFYDLLEFPDDLPFYEQRLPGPDATVLELGCGTGRVLVPLAECCGLIHGIDTSEAMLEICREKIREANLPPDRARVEVGDASAFDLGRTFDLIIAPYRVFQALETDEQADGLMRSVARHLAPGGSCILTMFMPYLPPDRLWNEWVNEDEVIEFERPINGERFVLASRRTRLDRANRVIYPDLIFRLFIGDRLLEEVVMRIVMRIWYPDEIRAFITGHGFRITGEWGGYAGEAFGEGPELVVEFAEK
jgi:SAM-dependent methyltransferase